MKVQAFAYFLKGSSATTSVFFISFRIRLDVDVAYHLLAELLAEGGFNVGGYSVSLLHADVGLYLYVYVDYGKASVAVGAQVVEGSHAAGMRYYLFGSFNLLGRQRLVE